MKTFLALILLFIIIDIYYRLKRQKQINGLFFYSSTMSNYYEEILLSKKILSKNELLYKRKYIEEKLKENWEFSEKILPP